MPHRAELRVLCVLASVHPSGPDLAQALTEAAGLPVVDVTPISERVVAARLLCDDTERCTGALARLRGARPWLLDVTPQSRAQRPTPPTAPQERP